MEELLRFEQFTLTSYETLNMWQRLARRPLRIEQFTCYQGEIIGIIGESGAGKTLWVEALVGGLAPNIEQTGNIYYKQQLVTQSAQQLYRGTEWFYVPQSTLALNPLLTIGQQLRIFQGKITAIMVQQVGLHLDDLTKYPHELSGGMKKKVLFLFAQLRQRSLVIADEPTRGLDVDSIACIEQCIRQQHAQGTTYIIISHDFQWLMQLATRIVVMRQGEIIEQFNVTSRQQGDWRTHYTQQLWYAQPQQLFLEGESIC